MPENRRVKLTKRVLKDVMLELLKTKQVNKISITEICSLADMNRSTFYAYYNEPSDLLRDIEDEVLEQVPIAIELDKVETDEQFLNMIASFLEYIKKNEALFRILICQQGDVTFTRRLADSVLDRYHYLTKLEDTELAHYGYIYTINGVMGLLREWIEQGFSIPSRAIARLALQMSVQANNLSPNFLEKDA